MKETQNILELLVEEIIEETLNACGFLQGLIKEGMWYWITEEIAVGMLHTQLWDGFDQIANWGFQMGICLASDFLQGKTNCKYNKLTFNCDQLRVELAYKC